MKNVITLAREYGSGGREIARRVAEGLAWRLVDRELIAEVARRADVPNEAAAEYDERLNPWMVRMAKGLWAGSADSFAAAPRGDVFDADLMAELTRRVILEAAAQGSCVILGRGAQCILRDRTDALHVFVYAPAEDRVRRLARRHGGEAAARIEMERADRTRAAYVQHYYGCDRTARELYDLMVNSRIGVEAAVRMVVCAMGRREAPG
ncbi:MAG: cytidylate kinase-like family protein [Acidobacteriia bacterium]|nr:cytidylate kinase-like family protein [Terriglobia bacterium]